VSAQRGAVPPDDHDVGMHFWPTLMEDDVDTSQRGRCLR
jgi:hypothetical protein